MIDRNLGEFEHIVLLALIKLHTRAYGANIRQFLHREIGRDVALGALYSTLTRMEKKGLVVSALGEATAERGGRPKRYFTITNEGKLALKHAKEVLDVLWRDIALYTCKEGLCAIK